MSLDILNIRELIANRVITFLEMCERANQVRNIVFQTFPGSGKTTTIMKAIDDSSYTWIYLAPFHDIILENLEFSHIKNYDFIWLKGKEQDGVCLSDEYQEYAKRGINITPFCETRCPFHNEGCPYYETLNQIREYPQHWAGVHAHIPTFLQSFFFQYEFDRRLMFNYFDVIILDEFPFQVLFNQVRVSRRDTDIIRDIISQMTIDSPERQIFSRFLDQLSLASGLIPLNHRAIKSIMDEDRGLDYRGFIDEYDRTLLELVRNNMIERPPKKILHNFKLLYEANPEMHRLEWMVYKHRFDGWMKEGIYITTSNIDYFRTLPIPVVALDATAEANAWRTLLNDDHCLFERIDIEYKNAYQMKGRARYPVSSWVSIEDNVQILSQAGIKLCKLIEKICRRKQNKVLICSNKRIRGLIKPYLKSKKIKNVKFAIYYNLRSRNDFYEECDTCIIAHEPNIPPLQLEIMTNVTEWNEELLRELMTKDEILQAIGRIRQNIKQTPYGRERELIEIYIFVGSMNENGLIIEEAKLVPYNNMMVGKLISISEVLKQMMKNALNSFTFEQLRVSTKDLCSRRALQSIVNKLELDGFISRERGQIKWIFDEDEATRTNYRRLFI